MTIPEIISLAEEIARYLREHPHAADSASGVLRWWLPRQRYEESADMVQEALEHLVAQGALRCETLIDGTVLYASVQTDAKPEWV